MRDPQPLDIRLLLERIQKAEEAGQGSLQLLEETASRNGNDARVLLLLAGARMHAQEVDGAEAAYIAALQVAPEFHIARFQLGLLQLTSARPAAALSTWAPLQALSEEHPLRTFASGLTCLARDEFAEARRLLELGIARNLDNAPLNRDMRMVLERMPDLGGGGGTPGTEPAPEAAPAASTHFLVSSYRSS